jgi:hypothetical protein
MYVIMYCIKVSPHVGRVGVDHTEGFLATFFHGLFLVDTLGFSSSVSDTVFVGGVLVRTLFLNDLGSGGTLFFSGEHYSG